MAILRYPSDVTQLGSYLMIMRYEFKGEQFNTKELFDIGNFSFKKLAQLQGVIALPVPNGLVDATSVSWADFTDQTIGGALLSKTKEYGAGISSKAVQQGARVSGVVESKTNVVTYEGTSVKQYSFAWQCIPQSKSEADNLEAIIDTFELGMLSSRKSNGDTTSLDFVNYVPDIWQVEVRNVRRLKILPCVLTDISVDLNSGGTFQAMADGNLPTYNISITFREIVNRTKDIYSALKGGTTL